MDPLGHGAIRFPHRGDHRKCGAFPVCLFRFRLQFLDASLRRGFFLVRESLGLLVDRGGALPRTARQGRCGGLLHVLLWAHRNLLK